VRALRANRLRTALTTLGVVVGVAAVVAMLALGRGAQADIAEKVRTLGSNVVVVLSGNVTSSGVRLGAGSGLTITEDDASAIQGEIAGVQVAAPIIRGTGQAVFGPSNWATLIEGTTPEFLEVREWPIEAGRGFQPDEMQRAAKVALVGQTVAFRLFGEGANPVGETIRVRNVPFTVIGVLGDKGQSAWGLDQDDTVMIPIATARSKVLGSGRSAARSVNSINVKIRPDADLFAVQEEIRALLRQRHRLEPDQDDDFRLRNVFEMLDAEQASARVMTSLLAAIAGISLLVGGIGIMNIMLVSVAERTPEIGLRMAVGARSRDIRAQFLVEAVTVAGLGGVAGIGLGVGTSVVLERYLAWRTVVSADAIGLAFGSALVVGICSSLYPAHRAACLDPIEALRRH
jgi:putative ABC transport system permease protein